MVFVKSASFFSPLGSFIQISIRSDAGADRADHTADFGAQHV